MEQSTVYSQKATVKTGKGQQLKGEEQIQSTVNSRQSTAKKQIVEKRKAN